MVLLPHGEFTWGDRVVDFESLRLEARRAAENAYCPYSRFRVGAAVLSRGAVFTGCNVENASYGLTICAERNAIFHAVSVGHFHVDAIAVSCIDAEDHASADLRMPCGACRQVIAEFSSPESLVIVDGVGRFKIEDLLPRPFRLKVLASKS